MFWVPKQSVVHLRLLQPVPRILLANKLISHGHHQLGHQSYAKGLLHWHDDNPDETFLVRVFAQDVAKFGYQIESLAGKAGKNYWYSKSVLARG